MRRYRGHAHPGAEADAARGRARLRPPHRRAPDALRGAAARRLPGDPEPGCASTLPLPSGRGVTGAEAPASRLLASRGLAHRVGGGVDEGHHLGVVHARGAEDADGAGDAAVVGVGGDDQAELAAAEVARLAADEDGDRAGGERSGRAGQPAPAALRGRGPAS